MKRQCGAARFVSASMLALTLTFGLAITSCRTTSEDVQRWAHTSQGPRKLAAVITHDKYPLDLRVEAAVTLVSMKPRSGRRVGITRLLETFNQMPEGERANIISAMIPRLVAEVAKPPKGSGETRVDTSTPYKDAAYALLTNDGAPLVTNPDQMESVKTALTSWASTDFAARMDDSSQMYGVEQVLRYLGPRGVKNLPALMTADALKVDRISDLIAELGDKETKLAASKRLVAIATEIDSPKWLETRAPRVDAANKISKLNPTKEQFQKQLAQYQEEESLRIFQSMKKVGQRPAVEYLLSFANNSNESDKRRAAALAALEGNLDKNDPAEVESVLNLAGADTTPDTVRDVALRRVGEMPRALVVDRLYQLFKNENWKIRWVAAELVLRMSDQSQLDEFMSKLGAAKGMAITEPLRYGQLIAELKGKTKPEALADRYATTAYPSPVRLSALGYYYQYGTKQQVAKVEAYATDEAKVPGCLPDAKECEWKCAVSGGKELKEIHTVGEFVDYCVKPAMLARDAAPKHGEKANP